MQVTIVSNTSRKLAGWTEAFEIMRGAAHTVTDPGPVTTVEGAMALVQDADALFVGLNPITREVLEAAVRARVVARPGVGMDNVDAVAATELGILVCNTPGSNADSVADHTLGMVLGLIRKLPEQDLRTRTGKGWSDGPMVAPQLTGKRVAILGTGNVGRGVARRMRGFGVTLVGYDPLRDPAFAAEVGLAYLPFPEVLRGAHVVTVHVPLFKDTEGLLGAAELALLNPGAIVIAISRAGVVDETALLEALQSGHLGGAGVDVWATEPLLEHPLYGMPNTILSAHTAGFSPEAATRARVMAAESVVAALRGEPRNIFNPEVLKTPQARLR